jgi:hypothetical protein
MGTLPAASPVVRRPVSYILSSRHPPGSRGDGGAADGPGCPGTSRPLILVVDDEPDNLDVLQWFLRDEGFALAVGSSGGGGPRNLTPNRRPAQIMARCRPGVSARRYFTARMTGSPGTSRDSRAPKSRGRDFTRKSQAINTAPAANTTSPGSRIHCQNSVLE